MNPDRSRGSRIRALLFVESAAFFAAALVHWGVLIEGYQHSRARIAETVIGAVLLAGAVCASIAPSWTRPVALGTQLFALLGTLVGMVMVAIGVGPQTRPDIVYHIAMVLLLVYGIVVAVRMRRAA